MARKMIDYVRYVFDTLSEGISIQSLIDAKISPPNREAAPALFEQFLRLRVSEPEYLINNIRLHEITCESTRYIAFTNLLVSEGALPVLKSEGIVRVDANPALLLASLKDMSVRRVCSVNLQELEQNVLSQQEDSAEYIGHDLEELLDFFEPVVFFEIMPDSIYSSRLVNEVAYYVASYSRELINPKLEPFLVEFRSLLSHDGSFMKQNIFWSMTSTHYKHAFLELYRCVESVYTLPRALSLKSKTGLTLAGHLVAKICIEELGWRRKEEDSLFRVLSLMPVSRLQLLALSRLPYVNSADWDFNLPETNSKGIESLARFIYKLRNQMVHQFDAENETTITNDDWSVLIELLISVIDYIFVQYAAELPQATPVASSSTTLSIGLVTSVEPST